MTGDTAVEVPVVVDNKVEEVVKTDKEVIAEEEKELIENEKTDEPEKTEEDKEEAATEPKPKVPLLQKLFGKRKDYVVPKADEVPKTDKEVVEGEEDKPEKVDEEKEEPKEEPKKEETETVQHRFKKLFSMKKAKKEETEKVEKAEGEDKIEEADEVKEGEEKKDEEKVEETKEGETKEEEETVETAEADVSKNTAEKKTLMQKLMTIKRDLMANKKEDKVEEEKKEEKEEEKEGEEAKEEDSEKKEGEEEVKVVDEEVKEDDNKDELGNEKPKPTNRIKKFFSMKRERKTTEVEKKVEETVEDDEAPAEEVVEEKKEEVVEVVEVVDPVMKLHLANRTPVIPSISAMHLKLESWLKFHGVKYENTHDKDCLPVHAYQPMQSNDYLNQLADTHDKQMPMQLDADQKNVQIAMTTLVEKNIHFAILSWQCSNIDNILKGYKVNLQAYMNSKAPLALLKLMFKNNFCKNGQKLVKSNGFGQKTESEIEELAKPDLKVLAEMLGENDFFFGTSASLLDLVVFSHLVQVTVVDETVACSLRDHIKTEHANLISHVDRMKTLIWGDDWVAATEKLDLNPHIPKPIVEEVKEIVDEVVEKVVEDKATEETPTEEKTAEEKPAEDKVEESKTTEEAEKTD